MARPRLLSVGPICLTLSIVRGLVFSAIVPLESTSPSGQPICDRFKVTCEAGWQCQAGYLFFPVAADMANCHSEELQEPHCKRTMPLLSEGRIDSMEVFCVRQGYLGESPSYNPGSAFHKDLSFLGHMRKRSRQRRSAYQDQCRTSLDCGPQEECRFRTGCSLIKQGDCYNGNVCLKRPQPTS
ncbi:hypothetical protein RvY_06245 [Ramazzottius varieornatus]|uniref:Chitin-binding type-2 domain-containing protein n=1 Tax=Ramazzottius varieornatus TaxID=947166 RepID=A0A1D1UXV8_RAMVA|nr:hypothetical protein RvY_06245 [Ramazzottius varieornatus]